MLVVAKVVTTFGHSIAAETLDQFRYSQFFRQAEHD